MTDWQPIETAPKDGTEVLVWRPQESCPDPWEAHMGIDYWKHNLWFRSRLYQQPTHWMPLPKPPLSVTSGSGN